MVDEKLLRELKIHEVPFGQLAAAKVMWLNHNLPPKSTIDLIGTENIPRDRGVIFAMNHTDRYTYWPFQYQLYQMGGFRFTSTWVKAKYYKNKLVSWALNNCNGIPLPSRGYLILQDAIALLGRKLSNDEYRLLRDLSDGIADADRALTNATSDVRRLLTTARRDFDPTVEGYADYIDRWNNRMMALVEARTLEALGEKKNNLIVFPQGTRSIRLLPSRTGMMQFALRHEIPVVPVGANGVDIMHPGANPWAKGKHVVYRIGKPLTVDDVLSDCRVGQPFTPFTRDAKPFEEQFQRASEKVTLAINDLLDDEYKLDQSTQHNETKTSRLI
jgi:1-acyl-sn-glycerol-3-phosphate acyltransferase